MNDGTITREAKKALSSVLESIGSEDALKFKDNAQLVTYIEWAIKNSLDEYKFGQMDM